MDREHVKGAADKAKGAIKERAGKPTGDKDTVSLHGVEYDGYIVETHTKNKLLRAELFEEVNEIVRPYYAKLLQ
jgi:hypothetical protein